MCFSNLQYRSVNFFKVGTGMLALLTDGSARGESCRFAHVKMEPVHVEVKGNGT